MVDKILEQIKKELQKQVNLKDLNMDDFLYIHFGVC